MVVTDKYVFFYRNYYSQWHIRHFKDEHGREFNCAEQYMMWHKAMTFGDTETASKIMEAVFPGDQKALGRQVKGYVDKQWDIIRLEVVAKGNYLKFSQHADLKKHLIEDHKGKIFVEASAIDPIWGVGLWEDDPLILDEKNWKGTNLLGKALNMAQEMIMKEEVEVSINANDKTEIFKGGTKIGSQG